MYCGGDGQHNLRGAGRWAGDVGSFPIFEVPMIDARVDGDSLVVEATGIDYWPHMLKNTRLATRLNVRVPLEHITGARARPPDRFSTYMIQRTTRTLPGVFHWYKRRTPRLFLDMDGQPYSSVVLSVPDPERLAEQIRCATGVGEIEPQADPRYQQLSQELRLARHKNTPAKRKWARRWAILRFTFRRS
jgi:hypothetical protein